MSDPTTVAPMPDVSVLADASLDDWLKAQHQWFGQVIAMQQAWAAAWWGWQLGLVQPMVDGSAWMPTWTRWYNGTEQLG